MQNSHRYFCNRECKYYPCHKEPDADIFNCLFCYCPLYYLGDRCGGMFIYSGEKHIKSCMDCHLPHKPEFYDTILAKLEEESS